MKNYQKESPTRAKLPKAEELIDGDAGKAFKRTDRLRIFEHLFKDIK